MTMRLRNDGAIATESANAVLQTFNAAAIAQLSPAERIAYAQAEATAAIANSLLTIANLEQKQADVRSFRSA